MTDGDQLVCQDSSNTGRGWSDTTPSPTPEAVPGSASTGSTAVKQEVGTPEAAPGPCPRPAPFVPTLDLGARGRSPFTDPPRCVEVDDQTAPQESATQGPPPPTVAQRGGSPIDVEDSDASSATAARPGASAPSGSNAPGNSAPVAAQAPGGSAPAAAPMPTLFEGILARADANPEVGPASPRAAQRDEIAGMTEVPEGTRLENLMWNGLPDGGYADSGGPVARCPVRAPWGPVPPAAPVPLGHPTRVLSASWSPAAPGQVKGDK